MLSSSRRKLNKLREACDIRRHEAYLNPSSCYPFLFGHDTPENEELEFFAQNGIPLHWWNKESEISKLWLNMYHRQDPGSNLSQAYIDMIIVWMRKRAHLASQRRFPYL